MRKLADEDGRGNRVLRAESEAENFPLPEDGVFLSRLSPGTYGGGACPIRLSAHSMKYFMFGASV